MGCFYLFNIWFHEAPFRECEMWQTLAIKSGQLGLILIALISILMIIIIQ